MPRSTSADAAEDFFAVAAGLGLLDGADVEHLRQQCLDSGVTASRFVLERNLLDAVEADIVETLAAPEDAIPGYRILSLIGRGGMGVVYRAEQLNLGRMVALKTILVSRMSDRAMLDRFEREARTIGQLRHPNIIAAHDFGRHSGRLYLAMELVEGTDLDQRLKTDGPLNEHSAWNLARQAAAGLAHAVQRHVVHRDIKPANLILVAPPEGYPLPPGVPMVKIADFGLALLQGDLDERTRLTEENTTLGSPHYMAPEQMESSDVDGRADMYALGATVYHALAGRPPFSGMKLSQLIAAKLGDGPPPLADVQPGLDPATCRLVMRMLARQPSDRPANYDELLREIDAALRVVPTMVLPAVTSGSRTVAMSTAGADEPTDQLRAARTDTGLEAGTQPHHPPIARAQRRLPLIGAGVVSAAALILAAFWLFGGSDVPPLPQTPVPTRQTGPAVHLFNGQNTLGWEVRNGDWVGRPDAAVLTATQGVIGRGLFVRGADGRPRGLDSYHLEVLLQPLDQTTAEGAAVLQEVHFGLESAVERNGRRYVLQRSPQGMRLGERSSDSGDFTPDPRIPPRPFEAQAALAVTIDCVTNGWFVQINGEPFAALPRRAKPELPEFRLRVVGGRAEFSDLLATELTAAE